MIWLCNMACFQEDNINIKINDKQTKYQQIAFEMRERTGYKVINSANYNRIPRWRD